MFYFLYKYNNNFLFPKIKVIKVHEHKGQTWWYSGGEEKNALSVQSIFLPEEHNALSIWLPTMVGSLTRSGYLVNG